jgi:hypothetical protein
MLVGWRVRSRRCWTINNGVAFPGPSMLGLDGGEAGLLLKGVLVEYPDSEAAIAWSQHFRDSRRVRHYSVAFLAENRLMSVLANRVSLNR